MNRYKKYCPNVWVAECDEKHEKGDIIEITTKRGKVNEHIIHNLVDHTGTQEHPRYFYSITRADGFNSQKRAENRLERLEGWANSREKKGDQYYERSRKDSDFLVLAEPIKIGHHSEKRHRKMIREAQNNTTKAVENYNKASEHRSKIKYWEQQATKIDLSMPESVEYFKAKYEQALQYHKDMKSGKIKKTHSYSLTYAKKEANELKKKYEISLKLWGKNANNKT